MLEICEISKILEKESKFLQKFLNGIGGISFAHFFNMGVARREHAFSENPRGFPQLGRTQDKEVKVTNEKMN